MSAVCNFKSLRHAARFCSVFSTCAISFGRSNVRSTDVLVALAVLNAAAVNELGKVESLIRKQPSFRGGQSVPIRVRVSTDWDR